MKWLILGFIYVNTACYQHCLNDTENGTFEFYGRTVTCEELCEVDDES